MKKFGQYFSHLLQKSWYQPHWITWLLLPLSWLFGLIVAVRRWGYASGMFKQTRVGVPVLVVGNITAGGAGKTPFVIWLVQLLQASGYKPGILSRGYGGEASYWPQQVREDSDPKICGEEPVLLARRCACPVVISPDRVAGARALLEHSDCDMIVTDDGLQHYALGRDIEIAMVDGSRRFGNKKLLPAGPLREPVSRLDKVDYLVVKGASQDENFIMTPVEIRLCKLLDEGVQVEVAQFQGHEVHAIAAISNPSGFFDQLRSYGIQLIEHPFPDHHFFSAQELYFDDDLPVLMTEKDAVKCRGIAHDLCWFLTFEVEISGQLEAKLLISLEGLGIDRQEAA